MDRANAIEGQRFAVLDIETKPDGQAVALLRRDGAARIPSCAHRIVAATVLTAREDTSGRWVDLAIRTAAEPALDEPDILLDIDDALASTAHDGTCVTFNGLAHDLPTIRRRAARHLMFDLPGVAASEGAAHVDLMRRVTRGWRDEWPSLKAACAGLGIPVNHAPSTGGGEDVPAPVRKCETDVVCTFLLLLYELAIARRDGTVLARGWEALAGFARRPHAPPHIVQFARHLAAQRVPAP